MHVSPALHFVLAQVDPSVNYFSVLVRLGILVVVVAGLLLCVWFVRARIHDATSEPARDFSISDFRQLVREGKMSQEEFDRAKGTLIAKEQAKLQPKIDRDARRPDARVETKS